MALDLKIKTNAKQISKRYSRLQSKFPRLFDKGLLQAGFHLLDIIRTKTAKGIDFRDVPFASYSESYRKQLQREGKPTAVDLFYTGRMLGALSPSMIKKTGKHKVTLAFSRKDEIDKAFSEQTKGGDSGTTNRVLGTFITWLSEKRSQVFIVATANNFSVLPLEIIRKGRFDEIFFVGLPILNERQQIFNVFLNRLRPNQLGDFDLALLAKKSEGFSGAEIEQAIVEGMLIAFNEKREFNTADIVGGLKQIIPLSQIEPERTKQLQDWAISGRVRLAA